MDETLTTPPFLISHTFTFYVTYFLDTMPIILMANQWCHSHNIPYQNQSCFKNLVNKNYKNKLFITKSPRYSPPSHKFNSWVPDLPKTKTFSALNTRSISNAILSLPLLLIFFVNKYNTKVVEILVSKGTSLGLRTW